MMYAQQGHNMNAQDATQGGNKMAQIKSRSTSALVDQQPHHGEGATHDHASHRDHNRPAERHHARNHSHDHQDHGATAAAEHDHSGNGHGGESREHGEGGGESVDDSSESPEGNRPALRRRKRATLRRLSVKLPEHVFQDIERLAHEEGKSLTEVLRIGLGLAFLAAAEKKKGGTLCIKDPDGALHRVVIAH
jgi:hypothetical protein